MGTVVAARIDAAGLSRREVASRTCIPLTTLTRRLSGASPFNVAELATLASVLGTTVSSLAEEAESVVAA